ALVGKSTTSGSSLDQFRAVVWDLPSRQRIWNSPSLGHLGNTFYPCALAPSGASFALCQDINNPVNYESSKNTAVQIWDIQHNRLLTTWNVQGTAPVQEQTENFAVTTMVWSPDNTRLALICAGGSVQVWDVAQGSHLWTYHIANGRGAALQWSPDGSTLAVSLSQETTPPIEMLDAHTGKLLFQTSVLNFSLYGVNEKIVAESSSLLWSRDGTRLALLVYERGRYDVQVCDAHTGQRLFICQHVEGRMTGCSWSPDGRYLAAGIIAGGSSQDETLGEGSTIQFWDAQSGKALFAYQSPRAPSQLIWSADSHFLATYNPQDFGRAGIHTEFRNFALQVFQVGNLG
ncbi:MAG: WD40 repeat domain-containing protein, partial [Ktedonobacteraceae bacterium]|nr:WD40 repeat domain-containing protein [Ktedonobacteraceae bacterium]